MSGASSTPDRTAQLMPSVKSWTCKKTLGEQVMFHLPFLFPFCLPVLQCLPFSLPFRFCSAFRFPFLQVGKPRCAVHFVVCQHTHALPPPLRTRPSPLGWGSGGFRNRRPNAKRNRQGIRHGCRNRNLESEAGSRAPCKELDFPGVFMHTRPEAGLALLW